MLRYIGPFLRMNKLTIDQIQSQLLHLSKESIKELVLYSKVGITLTNKDLNLKNISSTDINTIKSNSPLLCIYKKANPKLKNKNNTLYWDEETFKKDINISSNAYMTLCLLELVDYYKKFKNLDSKKYALSIIYTEISKKQLEFYASSLRNELGIFVDKKDYTDPIIGKLKLKDKNKGFKFSEQALLMNAFYKCSTYLDDKFKNSYKNFALDILNMFIEFKEEMYDIPFDEKCKLCLNLNIFYDYSKIEDVKPLILDIFDLLYENYISTEFNKEKIEYLCLMYLNSALLYKHTNMYKFKKISQKINKILCNHYNEDLCMFIKFTEDKEIKFTSTEIILYILCMLYNLNLSNNDDMNEHILINVFKNQLINSGIILSWPDAPHLDDIEHYKDFNLTSESLLDDQYFKLPTIVSFKSAEIAPIFIKSVTYNKNKHTFKQSKIVFDSRKNLNLFFIIFYLLNRTS